MSPHEARFDAWNDPAPWSQTFFRGLLVGLVVGACLSAPIFFVLIMSILGSS